MNGGEMTESFPKTLCQTYVIDRITFTKYYVSTVNWASSSPEGYPYAKTMAWEFDEITRQNGKLVYQDWGALHTITTHLKVVQEIFNGKLGENKELRNENRRELFDGHPSN